MRIRAQELKDIVRLCLRKDPAERPSCALLLRHKFWKARPQRPRRPSGNIRRPACALTSAGQCLAARWSARAARRADALPVAAGPCVLGGLSDTVSCMSLRG